MAIFTIKGFAGMKPILDARLLQPNEAQYSKNVRIQSGSIVPYKEYGSTGVSLGQGTPANVKRIYPVLNNSKWLSWTVETDVIDSPVMGDQWNRVYWTGDSFPKYGPKDFVTNGSAPYPSQYYKLGIPKPVNKPVATGAAITEVTTSRREYAVTYLNAAGTKESSIGTTASTSCISAHYDYGLYDVTLSVSGTTVTAVFTNTHDFATNDYIKLTSVSTAFKVTAVTDAKTVTFDRGAVAVSAGATTASRRVMAKAKLTALPTTGNFQSGVTQKKLYRKKDGVYRYIATVALANTEYEDILQDSEVTGATMSNAVLYTPPKPGYPPTAGYAVGDTSLADNAALANDLNSDGTPNTTTSPAATYQRVYAYAWLHDSGYESPISGTSGLIQVVDSKTRVKVSMPDPIPDGCSKKRLYRQDVNVASGGSLTVPSASFRLVSELPASQVSYEDILDQATLNGRAAPTNADGFTPPEELFGAVGTSQPVRSSESRVYVYTYVTAYGEEGPPSDPSELIDIDPAFPVSITNMSGAPTGNYNITKKYIYRTATAAAGATDYQLVTTVEDGIPVAQASYTDKVLQAALGETIPSINWVAPPTDLQGLRMMANGIAIGWSDKRTICFSEPYQPHAYPTKYQISVDYDVVGIGVMGQSAAILTKGYPYIVSGIDPVSMMLNKLPLEQACVSKRSIVEMGVGVMYASPDGLVMIGPGGVDVVTKNILSQAQWQAYNPSSIHAYWHENRYHGYCTVGNVVKMFIFDPTNQMATWTETDLIGYAAHRVVQDDNTYVVTPSGLQSLFGGTGDLTYTWRSKIAQLPAPMAMSFGQVQAQSYPVTINIIADGVATAYTATSADPFRLISGFMAREWEVEVSGTAVINSIAIAQSAWELKGV